MGSSTTAGGRRRGGWARREHRAAPQGLRRRRTPFGVRARPALHRSEPGRGNRRADHRRGVGSGCPATRARLRSMKRARSHHQRTRRCRELDPCRRSRVVERGGGWCGPRERTAMPPVHRPTAEHLRGCRWGTRRRTPPQALELRLHLCPRHCWHRAKSQDAPPQLQPPLARDHIDVRREHSRPRGWHSRRSAGRGALRGSPQNPRIASGSAAQATGRQKISSAGRAGGGSAHQPRSLPPHLDAHDAAIENRRTRHHSRHPGSSKNRRASREAEETKRHAPPC
eukprot:scaffold13002_cov125-Isochrysis_galbana.AAC.4